MTLPLEFVPHSGVTNWLAWPEPHASLARTALGFVMFVFLACIEPLSKGYVFWGQGHEYQLWGSEFGVALDFGVFGKEFRNRPVTAIGFECGISTFVVLCKQR
jgi:hypothetical protein